LLAPAGRLEFFRTKEIISRYLPRRPGVVLDIGGGPGAYAFWLARLGHTVHLVDGVSLHLQKVRQKESHSALASITLGDARRLLFEDRSAEAVLLLGPLYHLVRRHDRIKALSEARRTLKPGGLLFVAVISRFASALDGLCRGFIRDSEFFSLVCRDLRSGQHRNPTDRIEYFTTAFFHHPSELESEMRAAGVDVEGLFAIEGPGWLVPDIEKAWGNRVLRGRLLSILRSVEREPTLLGASAHILGVARRPQ